METKALQRFCAIALGLGAILIAVYSIAFSVLFPVEGLMHDLGPMVLRPAWFALGFTAFVAILLMMIGFGGAYSTMAPRSGVLGLVGFLTIELAYLLQAAKVTWELCVYPMLARNAGAASLLVDRAMMKDAGVATFRLVAMLSIFAGVVLFCLAIVRSRVLPSLAGLLILAGAVTYGVGPMISITLAHVGIVVLAAGCLVLARALLRLAASAAPAPSRSVPRDPAPGE
jgi:hypothetical protein